MTTLPASNPFVALQRLAGAAAEDMAFLDERTRMQYTALGTVFALNFVFLCAAWMKVGYVYLGPVGLLVPGLALPALMVLGLDRVAAMRPRPLEGDLADFANGVGQANTGMRREQLMRCVLAAVAASTTTFTVMLTLSADSIQERQLQDAAKINAPLRAEMLERIEARHAVETSLIRRREVRLFDERATLDDQIGRARAQLDEQRAMATSARIAAAGEAGGLSGLAGAGPRYRAQAAIAQQHATLGAAMQAQLETAVAAHARVSQELSALSQQLRELQAHRAREFVGVDANLKQHPLYHRVQSGLFSDATSFVKLYGDPEQSVGRIVITVLLGGVLFAAEAAAVLAMALMPITAMDVVRLARTRELAAAAMARSEKALARAWAQGPGVQVVAQRRMRRDLP